MLRKFVFVFVFAVCLLAGLILYDLSVREVPFYERMRLSAQNKIHISLLYGIPGSYDVILSREVGQMFSEEDVATIAHEFQSKFGGNITYVNKYGPNFGIEGISEDNAYKISSDEKVAQVLNSVNDSAPAKYY